MAAAQARAPARSIGVAAATMPAPRVIVDRRAAEAVDSAVAAEAVEAGEEAEEGGDEPDVNSTANS
jgi:hypothetical protein